MDEISSISATKNVNLQAIQQEENVLFSSTFINTKVLQQQNCDIKDLEFLPEDVNEITSANPRIIQSNYPQSEHEENINNRGTGDIEAELKIKEENEFLDEVTSATGNASALIIHTQLEQTIHCSSAIDIQEPRHQSDEIKEETEFLIESEHPDSDSDSENENKNDFLNNSDDDCDDNNRDEFLSNSDDDSSVQKGDNDDGNNEEESMSGEDDIDSDKSSTGGNDNGGFLHDKYIRCICPICTIEFKSIAQWHEHTRTEHNMKERLEAAYTKITKKRLECKTCLVRLQTRPSTNVKQHYLRHQKYGECFICRICAYKKHNNLCLMRLHVDKDHIAPNSCIYCGKFMKNAANISKHYINAHNTFDNDKILYNCPICSKQYACEQLWQEHCKKEHKLDELSNLGIKKIVNNFNCTKCTRVFNKNNTFFHLLCHASQHMTFKIFACKFCSMEFKTNQTMRVHICQNFRDHLKTKLELPNIKYSLHSNRNAFPKCDLHLYHRFMKFLCPVCKESFSAQNDWHTHITSQHDFLDKDKMNFEYLPSGKYKCLECQTYVHSNIETLQKHRLIHAPHKSFMCTFCARYFTSQYGTVTHIKMYHFDKVKSAEETPTCSTATDTIAINAAITKSNTAISSKIFKCVACEYCCCTQKGLDNHFSRIHTNLAITYGARCVKCLLCNQLFKDYRYLEEHIKVNHADSTAETSANDIISATTCRLCHRPFRTIDDLKRHAKSMHHTNKISCPECGKYTTIAQLRINHWKKEHGDIELPEQFRKQKRAKALTKRKRKRRNSSSDEDTNASAFDISENRTTLHKINSDNNKNNYKLLPSQSPTASMIKEEKTMADFTSDEDSNSSAFEISESRIMPNDSKDNVFCNYEGRENTPAFYRTFARFICPICAHESKSLKSWHRHTKTKHQFKERLEASFTKNDGKHAECKICFQRVPVKPNYKLRMHYLKHEKYKKCFICRICAHQSLGLKYLRKHVEKVHIAPNSCVYCGKYMKNAANISKHYINAHDTFDSEKILYNCPICSEQYTSEQLWQEHCKKVHQLDELANMGIEKVVNDNVENFNCTKCPRVFIKDNPFYNLLCHASRHMTNKILKCKFCPMEFESIKSMRFHICKNFREHLKTKLKLPNIKYSEERIRKKLPGYDMDLCHKYINFFCPVCNGPFSTQNEWHSHIASQHDFFDKDNMKIEYLPNGKYKCLECSAYVNPMIEFHQKHRLTHAPFDSFMCTLCESYFNSITVTMRHLKITHSNIVEGLPDKPTSSTNMATHVDIIIPSSNKIYKCAACTFAVSTTSALYIHFAKEHENLVKMYGVHCVKCLLCNELFKGHEYLEKHISTTHPESTTAENSDNSLINATTCRLCHRPCQTVEYLEKHTKARHTVNINDKISCPECGKFFTSVITLRQNHWRREHSDLEMPESLRNQPHRTVFKAKKRRKADEESTLGKGSKGRKRNKSTSTGEEESDANVTDDDNETSSYSGSSKNNGCKILKQQEIINKKEQKKEEDIDERNRVFKCVSCECGYTNPGALYNHLRLKHPDLVKTHTIFCVKCLLCQELFQNRFQLEIHITDSHSNEDDKDAGLIDANTCRLCHRVYKLSEGLERHKRMHSVSIKNKTKCPECESYLACGNTARSHFVRLHPDKEMPKYMEVKRKRSKIKKNK